MTATNSDVFDDLIQSVEQYRLDSPVAGARDPDDPRPFEDVVLPLVYAARRRLHRAMACPDSSELPRGLLSAHAYISLERGLLDRLCRLCSYTLQSEFSSFRPVGHNLLNALVGATGTARSEHYSRFVGQLLSSGLMPIFDKYPVLARLVATIVENWVAYCVEFQSHLRRDLPLIEQHFQASDDGSLGEVVHLRFGLSDFSRHGRSVMRLTFACGLTLAYKPKPLGMDRAFNQLIQWCNDQGLSQDLKVVRVLDRPGYGWMEWVDQQPCAEEDDPTRFYRRAGMLLALLHALRCTDCHYENLVAHGGHLVLIDGETLMAADLVADCALVPPSDESFWQSVVRTGMLPGWDTRFEASVACDLSALGSVAPQPTPTAEAQWKCINTDDMDVYHGSLLLPRQHNAAMLNGVIVSPADHVDDLSTGFAEMYRLLLRKQAALLAADGPLSAFRAQPVRYVFRSTEQYRRILLRSLLPERLQNGRDRSIELDRVITGVVAGRQPTKAWALLDAERQALEQLDVPRFEVSSDETTVRSGGQAIAPDFFDASAYTSVVERLGSSSEADLAFQLRIIEASFHAWRARSEKHFDPEVGRDLPSNAAASVGPESEHRRSFLTTANLISEAVASRAVRNRDGSVTWIGLAHLPAIGRYQVSPVDDGLYGGRCGIALFLAACDHVNRSDAYRSLVLASLQPLRTLVRNRHHSSLEQYVRTVGLGVADGIGGLVYALTCIAAWWQDRALKDEAEMLATAITPQVLEADQHMDVMRGAAGAILGLMKLYRARPSSEVLRIVRNCADWLCRLQQSGGEHAGSWTNSTAPRPLTGFSHGASGIAAALAQVYAVTRETKLLAAVQAAIEFEHTAFLPDAGNWIDFRGSEPAMPPCSVTRWCHGAPGIALARLALLSELQHPLVSRDLETALATTCAPMPHALDDLCCGNFGRFDILLHAATVLRRDDLSVVASQQASDILCRSETFRLAPCDVPEAANPGFFDGLAGIGYVLLRLAEPGDLPCVLAWQ